MSRYASPTLVIALFATIGGCSGCRPVVYPGDGRLVVVDVDPELDGCWLSLADGKSLAVGSVVRRGIRYWDAAGARTRANDHAVDAGVETAAPHLRIRGDCSDAGLAANQNADPTISTAQYEPANGNIELFLRYWVVRDVDEETLTSMCSTVAHEAGHAIGLDHVPEIDAVMSARRWWGHARIELSAADRGEWERVWQSPSRATRHDSAP
jgi:hypothetical protein